MLQRIGFEFRFCLELAVRPREADASSLNLDFVVYTMGKVLFTSLNLRDL